MRRFSLLPRTYRLSSEFGFAEHQLDKMNSPAVVAVDVILHHLRATNKKARPISGGFRRIGIANQSEAF